jgi:hypothetical protein
MIQSNKAQYTIDKPPEVSDKESARQSGESVFEGFLGTNRMKEPE